MLGEPKGGNDTPPSLLLQVLQGFHLHLLHSINFLLECRWWQIRAWSYLCLPVVGCELPLISRASKGRRSIDSFLVEGQQILETKKLETP